MEKLKFKTVGQFLVALEESPLFDENGIKYILRESTMTDHLGIEEYRNSECLGGNTSLTTAQKNATSHTFTRKPLPQDKDLIFWWSHDDVSKREVRFYNAKAKGVFGYDGTRGKWATERNIEVIPKNPETGLWDAPFAWANEAVKELED